MEKDFNKIASLLKVLANDNRLMILCTLMESPATVTQIKASACNNITQSALSQHLILLKAHGILESEKNGQNIVYKISDSRITELIAVLKEYYPSEERTKAL